MDGVPFEDDGGLGNIAAAEDRGRGRDGSEGLEDGVLELGESLFGDELGLLVAGDVDVDDAAGVDVGREEDGRELDLGGKRSMACLKGGIVDVVSLGTY